MSKKKIMITILGAIFICCIVIGGVILKACNNGTNIKVAKPAVNPKKYDILVEDWNCSVIYADLSNTYYLPESEPEDTVKILNTLVRPFFQFATPELMAELQKITQGKEYSFFVFYSNFIKKHRIQKNISFNTKQKSTEIKEVLYRLTKENTINIDLVKIIASFDKPCLFLEIFKDELHRRGMSRNIKSCKNLKVDKVEYPKIYQLINGY